MNILITGVAGFIGASCAIGLLNKNHNIFGIDNLDNYYSPRLKKFRIKELKRYKNFEFKLIDINNRSKLLNYFKKKKINTIIHFAAQAGVRHSFNNPGKYIDVNIFGFLNIIHAAKSNNIKKIIYASSSSVYGENSNFPISEKELPKPINIYGFSKKLNEDMAQTYHLISNISFIGLRFFTIYGEWGRPDMFLFKLYNSCFNNKVFYLNNFGNHERDFTYIGDVVKIVNKLINKKFKKHQIFNICSNKPINILNIANNFKKSNKINIKYLKKHRADILKTHGNNKKIKKMLNLKKFIKFENIKDDIFKWYKKKNISKY